MAPDQSEDLEFSLEGPDGTTEQITLPAALVEALGEGESATTTVADITTMAFTSRAHHLVHHGDAEDPALEAAEERILDLFEDRFGVTYAEATGHSH